MISAPSDAAVGVGLGPGSGWWARRGVAHVLAAAGEERSSVRRCLGRFPGLVGAKHTGCVF